MGGPSPSAVRISVYPGRGQFCCSSGGLRLRTLDTTTNSKEADQSRKTSGARAGTRRTTSTVRLGRQDLCLGRPDRFRQIPEPGVLPSRKPNPFRERAVSGNFSDKVFPFSARARSSLRPFAAPAGPFLIKWYLGTTFLQPRLLSSTFSLKRLLSRTLSSTRLLSRTLL